MNTFGPVNMSGSLLSLVAYVGQNSRKHNGDTVGALVGFLEGKTLLELNKAMNRYENWPIDNLSQLN
jgi:hypothetical protein